MYCKKKSIKIYFCPDVFTLFKSDFPPTTSPLLLSNFRQCGLNASRAALSDLSHVWQQRSLSSRPVRPPRAWRHRRLELFVLDCGRERARASSQQNKAGK